MQLRILCTRAVKSCALRYVRKYELRPQQKFFTRPVALLYSAELSARISAAMDCRCRLCLPPPLHVRRGSESSIRFGNGLPPVLAPPIVQKCR